SARCTRPTSTPGGAPRTRWPRRSPCSSTTCATPTDAPSSSSTTPHTPTRAPPGTYGRLDPVCGGAGRSSASPWSPTPWRGPSTSRWAPSGGCGRNARGPRPSSGATCCPGKSSPSWTTIDLAVHGLDAGRIEGPHQALRADQGDPGSLGRLHQLDEPASAPHSGDGHLGARTHVATVEGGLPVLDPSLGGRIGGTLSHGILLV